ncbi:hypothetical protein D3C76_844600 [compost metagenome]
MQLLVEETDLRGARAVHLLQAFELHCRGGEVFFENVQFTSKPGAAGVEQALLQVHGSQQPWVIVVVLEQGRVESDRIVAIAFGFQAVFHGLADDVLCTERALLGHGAQCIEAYHLLAFFNHIAFAHQDRLDRAAAQVLHRLAVAGDLDRAGGNHASVQWRQARPQYETAKTGDHHPHAPACRPACVQVDQVVGFGGNQFGVLSHLHDRLLPYFYRSQRGRIGRWNHTGLAQRREHFVTAAEHVHRAVTQHQYLVYGAQYIGPV